MTGPVTYQGNVNKNISSSIELEICQSHQQKTIKDSCIKHQYDDQ
jgi:hypothetical protein